MAPTIIGIDAHKRSHTMVAVNTGGQKIGMITVAATSEGHRNAIHWARTTFGTDILWGVEDTRALTATLERDFLDANQRVVRVPTHLMARARGVARERGKSDPIDALAVARTALAYPDLPVAQHTPWSRDIKLLSDHRAALVKARTQQINRVQGRLHELDPTYTVKPRALVHYTHQGAVREFLDTHDGMLADIARAELTEITRLTPLISATEQRLKVMVTDAAPALLQLYGCSTLTAAVIVGESADVHRFTSEAAYARYAGVAPVPYWSGDTRGRMRSHKGGNRALNMALHQLMMIRIMSRGPDHQDYRRLREHYEHLQAMRRLKRRLSRTVFSTLRADQQGRSQRETLVDMQRRLDRWQALLPAPVRSHRVQSRSTPLPSAVSAETAQRCGLVDLQAHVTRWEVALYGDVLTPAD